MNVSRLSLWLSLLACVVCWLPLPVFAQVGLAAKYVGDQGIANDPDVIFAENFEGPISTILSEFGGYTPASIIPSSDHPASSGGGKSVILHPVGSATLYKLLPQDYTQVYFRYYIKYEGVEYHHAAGGLGGYLPRTPYPQGDAGIKGIRSNGDRMFNVALEAQLNTRLDTYMNWVDMPGPGFDGAYYGRSMVTDLNIPIRPGVWQCIELMVKVNSTATSHDGELAIWIDGALQAHFKPGSPNGQYTSVGNWKMNPSGPPFPGFLWRDVLTYGINWIKVQNFDDVGSLTDLLVDDLVVATKYIGPTSRSTDTTPPAPPTNLRILP